MKDLGNTIDLAEKLEEHLEYEVLKPEEQEKMAKEEGAKKIENTKPLDFIGKRKKRPIRKLENKKEEIKEERIEESQYLRYVSELRKADSELALAKAESAELVYQMDVYKKHYTEYETIIRNLIQEQDSSLSSHMDTLMGLAMEVRNHSESLSSRIDKEIQRLTEALADAIEGSIRESCEQELEKVEEATKVLYDYSEKVKEQYIKFQKLEKVKFGLFIFSSVSSPIVLLLMVLSFAGIL